MSSDAASSEFHGLCTDVAMKPPLQPPRWRNCVSLLLRLIAAPTTLCVVWLSVTFTAQGPYLQQHPHLLQVLERTSRPQAAA